MTDKTCSVDDCEKKLYAKGLCNMHYNRQKRTGSVEGRKVQSNCDFPGCDRGHYGKGLCEGHYTQHIRKGQPLAPLGTAKGDLAKHFYATVDTETDECIEWPYVKSGFGYGMVTLDGRRLGTHVAAWKRKNGEVPEGHQINHHCDNPCCYNPKHLYAGTQAENIQDQVTRGRHSTAGVVKP
jgi:hypothetical protein